MRKITKKAAQALLNNDSFHESNTRVENGKMFLYGHKIAKRNEYGEIMVNFQGYNTNTTKERLNGLCELYNGTRPFYAGNDYPTDEWFVI